jgi:hypothetical protein
MRRMLAAVAVSCLCVFFQACISVDLTVKLNPDGSGTLVEKMMLQKQFIEQMKQFAAGFKAAGAKEDRSAGPKGNLFSAESAGARAASYGPGVKLVSARNISDDTAEGMEAVYSFEDVTKVHMSPKTDNVLPGNLAQGQPGATSGMPQALQFQKLPGGNALLTLDIPWDKAKLQEKGGGSSSAGSGDKSSVNPEKLKEAMQMFRGFRVALAVEPQGKLVSTNSPYVEGNRVTLFEVNMDELLAAAADPSKLAGMPSKPPSDLEEARKLLSQFKGIRLCLDPQIKIEFAPN